MNELVRTVVFVLYYVRLTQYSTRQNRRKSTTSVYTYGRVGISYILVRIGGFRHILVMNKKQKTSDIL